MYLSLYRHEAHALTALSSWLKEFRARLADFVTFFWVFDFYRFHVVLLKVEVIHGVA